MTILRRLLRPIAIAALLLLAGAPDVHAQQDVMRDVYGFYGSALDVEVATESAGRIRLIRGRRSRIEVAGRSPDGFTSAALGGRGVRRLTLTALGSERADFVVVVPEDVRVRVVWPGSNRSELFGPLTETAVYAWDTPREQPAFQTIRPPTAPERPAVESVHAASTPRILDIVAAGRLDRITVRVEPGEFALAPAHRFDERRSGDALLLTAPQNGDLTVFVPTGDHLTLRLDGTDAIVIEGGEITVLCESVLSQMLPGGRRWLTLTPVPRDGCDRAQETPGTPPRVTPAGDRRT